jgi:hypothetical protein
MMLTVPAAAPYVNRFVSKDACSGQGRPLYSNAQTFPT